MNDVDLPMCLDAVKGYGDFVANASCLRKPCIGLTLDMGLNLLKVDLGGVPRASVTFATRPTRLPFFRVAGRRRLPLQVLRRMWCPEFRHIPRSSSRMVQAACAEACLTSSETAPSQVSWSRNKGTGLGFEALVPSPSCPAVLEPKANIVPLMLRSRLW